MIKLNNHKFILASIGLIQAASVHASTDTRLEHFLSLSIEDLVSLETSIASGTKHTTTNAPAVVTLITENDIRATGATNLVDVLEGVPGIHIRMSHFANRPLIHFRGAKATQTLLLVNGSSMKDLMWGFGIFWKGLPASMIERIEIIRGPGSALFGADASAGVINVITKTAGKIEHSEAGLRFGSFDSKTAWMQHGTSVNGFDIGITAEVFTTDGYSPQINTDAQTSQDQTFNTDISHAPGEAQYGWNSQDIRFSIAKGNWRVHGDYINHTDLNVGLTGAGVLDPTTEARDYRHSLDLLYKNNDLSTNWALDSQLRYSYLKYSSGNGFQERPPGYTDTSGSYPDGILNQMRSAERRLVFETTGLYRGFDKQTIKLGAGHTWQDLYFVEQFVNSGMDADGNDILPGDPLVDVSDTPYAFAPERMRKIAHLFIEDIWSINRDWELTAGARYDDYSDFGDTLNPRLALVWQSTSKLTTKLIYGEAFRAPSYQELFSETSRSLPNADLKPERSKTSEISFSYAATQNLRLGMNLFHFDQEDIIRSISVTGLSKRQFQNTGSHTIRGTEIEARWQAMKNLSLTGNYSHLNQDDSIFRAVQQPDQEAYLRADWGFDTHWNWNLQTNWINERQRTASDTRSAVDDYYLTDTTIRYAKDTGDWEFATSIRNLFDEDAREFTGSSIPEDLPLPGRNIYAEMRYKF